MCGAAAVPIVSAVISGVTGLKQTQQAKKADKRATEANQIAKESSDKALAQQQREINRKNAKAPNVAAILQTNRQATQNSTLLSGPGGVSNTQLSLGRNTLLGQ